MGIAEIQIFSGKELRFIFHSFGMFFGPMSREKRIIPLFLGDGSRYFVEHEAFEMLNLQRAPCNESFAYDRDSCIKEQLDKVNHFATISIQLLNSSL